MVNRSAYKCALVDTQLHVQNVADDEEALCIKVDSKQPRSVPSTNNNALLDLR